MRRNVLREMNLSLGLKPLLPSLTFPCLIPQELYSQSYDEIGVMFASLPNFADFYTEESINNGGIECLRFLNEIISDFDSVSSRWPRSHLAQPGQEARERPRVLCSTHNSLGQLMVTECGHGQPPHLHAGSGHFHGGGVCRDPEVGSL